MTDSPNRSKKLNFEEEEIENEINKTLETLDFQGNNPSSLDQDSLQDPDELDEILEALHNEESN